MTGFVTAQYEIPDYGSADSGKLEYPAGAKYTLEKANGSSQTNRIGSDGMFALADDETATFYDQFRRGSYISVTEDVDQNVFDTTWTLYENGVPVKSLSDGNTVEIISSEGIQSLVNMKGTALKDGRQEVYQIGNDSQGQQISNSGYTTTGWAKKSSNEDEKNTIVFRSYSNPDNDTTAVQLKAVFTNRVKTGSITIQKDQAEGSDLLNGEYTFTVVFSNVAGMSLENSPIEQTITIKKGESYTIEGIPVGTRFSIKETSASDNATLEDVVCSGGGTYDPVTKSVSGTIREENQSIQLTFKNTLKPTVDIALEKVWENVNGIEIPESIRIQLQRSIDGEKWEEVEYGGVTEITISEGYDGKWQYSFDDLDRYVDYKANPKVTYYYRVVELDKGGNVIESGGFLEEKFKVTYSEELSFSEKADGVEKTEDDSKGIFTITNTYSPKTVIQIIKVDASTPDKKLGGVEFVLEKGKIGSDGKFEKDSFFSDQKLTTGTEGDLLGIAKSGELSEGTYRLTETKTVSGYSLLKSPIIVVIDRTGKCTVRSEDEDESKAQEITVDGETNTITLTVSNRLQFELPATGGYLRFYMIAGGLALAGTALFIYRLQKRRKEVKTPGKK